MQVKMIKTLYESYTNAKTAKIITKEVPIGSKLFRFAVCEIWLSAEYGL
jgi:hypothetical protein